MLCADIIAGFGGRAWDSTRLPLHASQLLLQHRQQLASGGSSLAQTSSGVGSQQSSSKGGPGTGAAPGASSVSSPSGFNWKAYLLRYPDLRSGNIRTKQAATWHYMQKGQQEHRSHQKIPILLRYTACQGLFNQMYAHLNALVLADYLGADVMLPPSVYRESFSKYFSMDLKKNQVKWTPADTGALLDVEAIQAHYAQKGEQTTTSIARLLLVNSQSLVAADWLVDCPLAAAA